jgi:hypothetical protein
MRAFMTQDSREKVHFADSVRGLGALAAEI